MIVSQYGIIITSLITIGSDCYARMNGKDKEGHEPWWAMPVFQPDPNAGFSSRYA
jgi:hypothetical protein